MMTNTSEYNEAGVELKLLSRKMVHKLNNTLFVIEAYKDMLKKDQIDPEFLENIQHIDSALREAQQILTDWRTEADKLVSDPLEEQAL